MFNRETLESSLGALPAIASCRRFVVAYSGGADSTALLVALTEIRTRQLAEGVPQPLAIRALHFNHRIHVDAAIWQQHCEDRCIGLGVEFDAAIWSASPGPVCSEDQARRARYQWLCAQLREDEVLVTAHHADDQAETLLLNMLQGRGMHRLGGIPAVRLLDDADSDGRATAHSAPLVARPLLDVRRQALIDYLQQRGLTWIEDAANFSDRYLRSFLRQQVMPLLRDRIPGCDDNLTRVARALQQANELLDQSAADALGRVAQPAQRRLLCLADPVDTRLLGGLPHTVQRYVIRRWVHSAGLASPGDRQLDELQRQLETADSRQNEIALRFNDGEILLHDHWLHLLMQSRKKNRLEVAFSAKRTSIWPGLDVQLIATNCPGLRANPGENHGLRWRWREGGERFHMPGKNHSQRLKKLYQACNIPRFERDRLPLLWAGDQLLWVNGIGFSDCILRLPCGGTSNDCFEPVFRYERESSILDDPSIEAKTELW